MSKTVLLLGAGSAVALEGKLTDELTLHIIKNFRLKDKNGKNFLSNITKVVGENNFEVILGVLDYVYYFLVTTESALSTKLYKNWIDFFNLNELVDTIPDIISEQNQNKYYFANNNIDDFLFYRNKNSELANFKHKYIELAIAEIHTIIQNHVYEYSTCKKRDAFFEYLDNIKQHTDSLRIYSLNYDCLPLLYLKNLSSEYSNGFNSKNDQIDIKGILTNESINCFYSLHGNIYLKTDGANKIGGNDSQTTFANSQFDHTKFIKNQKPDSFFLVDRYFNNYNDRKYTLDTGIISGFSKTELILEQPYQSYFHAFEKDVLSASKIIIIGYSFSDAHINRVIKNVFEARFNDTDLTIEIVSKNEEEMNEHFPALWDNCFGSTSMNYQAIKYFRVKPSRNNSIYINSNENKTLKIKIDYRGFNL